MGTAKIGEGFKSRQCKRLAFVFAASIYRYNICDDFKYKAKTLMKKSDGFGETKNITSVNILACVL